MGKFAQTITLRPGEGFLKHFKDLLEKRLIKQPTQGRICIKSKDNIKYFFNVRDIVIL